MKQFDTAIAASVYCLGRSKEQGELFATIKDRIKNSLTVTVVNGTKHQMLDIGYCRIHITKTKDVQECWISGTNGQTKVCGRNVSWAQVLAFILKTFW